MSYGGWCPGKKTKGHLRAVIVQHVHVSWLSLKKIVKLRKDNIKLFLLNCMIIFLLLAIIKTQLK
jgi:hypothetical protein